MCAMGVVAAVVMVMGSHGEETREEKFRGALVTAEELDSRATAFEIERLTLLKPSLTSQSVALGVGFALVAVGTVGFVFGLFNVSTLWGLVGIGGGAFLFAGGMLTVVIATLALVANSVQRRVLEQRIQKLKQGTVLPASATAPNWPTPVPTSVLARF
jgi:hypothetical protein